MYFLLRSYHIKSAQARKVYIPQLTDLSNVGQTHWIPCWKTSYIRIEQEKNKIYCNYTAAGIMNRSKQIIPILFRLLNAMAFNRMNKMKFCYLRKMVLVRSSGNSQGVKCIFLVKPGKWVQSFFLCVFMLYRYYTQGNCMMAFSQHWAFLYNTFYKIASIGTQNNSFTRFEKYKYVYKALTLSIFAIIGNSMSPVLTKVKP